MRVATYTQPMNPPRGSALALGILVLTVLLGSSALHTLMTHFVPALHSGIALLWLLTYAVAFVGLMFSHGINWISWLARYRILLVILLLGTIISVSWSLDAAVSAERVVHIVGCSVLAIYLGFMIPLLTTLRVTAIVMGPIMVASLAAAMLMPSVGMQEYEGTIVWSGILNSKNALGFWASIAVLLYLTLSASSNTLAMKMLCYVFAAISLFVLVKSDSATALVAMLIAGSLSLYLYIAFRFQLGFVRMVVMALLFAGLLGFALSNIDTAQIVGRSGDLTGRGEVWRQTWKLIMERPLTGYGYGAIWFPNDATLWMQQSLTDFTWVVYHAHNGFLQIASEIGLPLSCIALLMVAQQLIEIFYCQYERQQVGVLFVLAFVVAYLISNFSEARFLVNRELYWIFFLALPISMLRQINLVSVDANEESEGDAPYPMGTGGAYAHAGAPADKPWLRPIGTGDAQRLGNSGAGAVGATGAMAVTGNLTQHGLHGKSDIDLGKDAAIEVNLELSDYDLTSSSDYTLDNTRVEDGDFDGTQDLTYQPDNDDTQPIINPTELFHHEHDVQIESSEDRYTMNDTDLDVDRYDKKIDDDGK